MDSTIALLIDVVDSRKMADRDTSQHLIEDSLAEVNRLIPSRQAIRPTVGDEFQAEFASVGDALVASGYARLFMPKGIDLRFGIGAGFIVPLSRSARSDLQDGSAWWNARAAIEEAHRRAEKGTSSIRTWFRSADDSTHRIATDASRSLEGVINAYLLSRDHLIHLMPPRTRRLAGLAVHGFTQSEMAEREGISQSAVSQSVNRYGVKSLLDGFAAVREGVAS